MGKNKEDPTRRSAAIRAQKGAKKSARYARSKAPPPDVELKYIDTALGSYLIRPTVSNSDASATGQQALFGIPQGSLPVGNRIGNTVTIKSIWLRIFVELAYLSEMTNPNTWRPRAVRLVLVQDKHTNKTAHDTGLEFFSDSTQAPNTQYMQILRFRDIYNTDRFKVLWEETVDLKVTGAQVTSVHYAAVKTDTTENGSTNTYRYGVYGEGKSLMAYVPLNVKQTYSGTGYAVTNQVDNSFHLLAVCDEDFDAKQEIRLQYTCRTRYTDV